MMVEELVNAVTQKTGLNPEQSKMAVDTVMEFLKKRLPQPLAGSLDSLIGGGQTGSSDRAGDAVKDPAGALKGMFGKEN
ncbi:MAG TPA: hypothetical protein VFW83_08975 [Bryobacteraceae bacterium]|nr:hypothetical protein [Bryobacteraceae bacterium]